MNSNCLETLKGALLHVEKIYNDRFPGNVFGVEFALFTQTLSKCITEEQKRMNNTTPAPQGWIDIRERKPEIGQNCFVNWDLTGSNQGAMIYPCDGAENWKLVTHWMPVPPLPKQDPFEEWFVSQTRNPTTLTPETMKAIKEVALEGWNAGVKWSKESHE